VRLAGLDPEAVPARGRASSVLGEFLSKGIVCREYGEEEKAAVWHKGQPILGWSPDEWRMDHQGRPLFRPAYDDTGCEFGWKIAHIVPRERGGTDDLSNLRPVCCEIVEPQEPAPEPFTFRAVRP